ncbi:radical SAM protein [Lutispora thermophila]|uniref:4Fe-4S single cluster domain-containing protein n=1 Tax=Lutispora thermophila DSM 19022 TaxID=1122184 RepID=A0A1M6FWB9_9FIRM|nr:radical SAM protein [Lutispora thermophila]SHJ01982.1 4Fe-4S single cluster domain-containing protein [Lutispora thermophila DSM 19022]
MNYIIPRLRLTNYCNRECVYCFADDFLIGAKNQNHMSLEEINTILDLCVKNNIKNVSWQGGEPLIHPSIIEIIEIHKKYSIKVNIFTNGLFDEKIIPYLYVTYH